MNAVFERDHLRTAISKKTLWLRAAFAVSLGAVLGLRVLAATATSSYSDLGVSVLRLSVYAGLVVVLVAAPGSFATSLVHARAQATLPILLASPLTPFQVAWGAFTARAAQLGVFILACWPPIALALAYGGIRPHQVLLATAALAGTLLLAGAPSFLVSAFARSTGAAVVASYITVATLMTLLGVAGDALATSWPLGAASVSPIEALRAAVDPQAASAASAWGSVVVLVGGVVAALAAILLATWRLHREARGDLEAASDLRTARSYRPLVHENPVLDREIRTGGVLRAKSAGRVLLVVLVAAEAAYLVASPLDSLPAFAGVLVFQTSLLVLAAASAGATALTAEKETGALAVLRSTPLSPEEIVRGKLLGLFRGLAPSLAVPCVHLLIGAGVGVVSLLALPAYLVAGGVVSAVWVVAGMQQSLDQRDPQRAVIRTMTLLFIVGVLMALLPGVVLVGVAHRAGEWTRIPAAFGGNPVGAILTWVAACRTGGSTETTSLVPAPEMWERGLAFALGAMWLLLYAGAGWWVARRLARTYRTRVDG